MLVSQAIKNKADTLMKPGAVAPRPGWFWCTDDEGERRRVEQSMVYTKADEDGTEQRYLKGCLTILNVCKIAFLSGC